VDLGAGNPGKQSKFGSGQISCFSSSHDVLGQNLSCLRLIAPCSRIHRIREYRLRAIRARLLWLMFTIDTTYCVLTPQKQWRYWQVKISAPVCTFCVSYCTISQKMSRRI